MPSAGAARTLAKEGRYGKAHCHAPSFEQLHGCERLSRPRSEAIERELRWLSRRHLYVHEVVIFLGSLALPILIWRVALGNLDMRPAGKDRVLFRTPAAQYQILHTVHFVEFGRMHVPVEDDYVEVFRVCGNCLVRILRFRNGTHARAAESRGMKGDENLLGSVSLGFI